MWNCCLRRQGKEGRIRKWEVRKTEHRTITNCRGIVKPNMFQMRVKQGLDKIQELSKRFDGGRES